MESLVALALMSLIFFAASTALGTGLRGLAASKERLHMLTVAEAQLLTLLQGGTRTVSDGETGRDGPYQWRVSVTPYVQDQDPETGAVAELPPELPALDIVSIEIRPQRLGSGARVVVTRLVPAGNRR